MADESQEPIFFHEAHRAFLETPSADVLDDELIRMNLYRLRTGILTEYRQDRWITIFIMGVGGLIYSGVFILFMVTSLIESIRDLVEHGLPHWRLLVFDVTFGGCGLTIVALGALLGLWAFKTGVAVAWWTERRLDALLQKLAQNGLLIEGHIQSSQPTKKLLMTEIAYSFDTPSGMGLERIFFTEHRQEYEPGTPVWVLYLNDKISILL